MKVNKRFLLIGVILGLITVFFLNWYIGTLAQNNAAEPTLVDVVVAVNTIPQHVIITDDMVDIESIPEESVHPDAIRSLNAVIGAVSRSEIINGEQVLSLRIASDEIAANFSYKIPSNMRAITIPVTEISGVANHIVVGDKVDILVSYDTQLDQTEDGDSEAIEEVTTYTQFQNIEVLALGRSIPATSEEPQQEWSSLTLLVNPQQAEVVAYSHLMGTMHLTLRNPVDETIVELEFYNPSNFETYRSR